MERGRPPVRKINSPEATCAFRSSSKSAGKKSKPKKGPQEKKVVVVFSGVLVDFEEKEPKCGIYVGAGGLVVSISTSALILSGNS